MIIKQKKHHFKVMDAYQIHLERLGKAPKTIQAYTLWSYRYIIFLKKRYGTWVHPASTKTQDIDTFTIGFRDRPATVENQMRCALKSFLQFCDPDKEFVIRGQRKPPQTIPTLLSWNEGRNICDAMGAFDLIAWSIMGGGERLSDAVALKIEDVTIRDPRIYIKGWDTFISSQRTGDFEDQIVLARLSHEKHKTGKTWLFPGRKNPIYHIHASTFSNALKTIDKEVLGVYKDVTPLVLRHTFAALSFQYDKTFAWVYKRMGYKTTKTLEQIEFSERLRKIH